MNDLKLPNIIKCHKMYKLLEEFHYENFCHPYSIKDYSKFNEAIAIFCDNYGILRPRRIRFRRTFHDLVTCQKRKNLIIGLTYASGNIDILYPHSYWRGCRRWIGIVYHELGHYVNPYATEREIFKFERKMLRRK